jgi:hypothetical protein
VSAEKDSKQMLREAFEAAIRRSPLLDPNQKDDALHQLNDVVNGPPMVEPKDFMSRERAEPVRRLRVDEGYSLRALAAACATEWGASWGEDQYSGTLLCFHAAEVLRISEEIFHE